MMTTPCMLRAVLFLCFSMISLTRPVWAGDEPPSKTAEQGKDDLKRLVLLSRLVAGKPSLLLEQPSARQVRELSAEPFGCRSSGVNECLLSRIAQVLLQQAKDKEPIFAATQKAAVQIHFMRATDAWSDKDIENNWDVVKKWTDAAGPAVLLAGAFMLSQEKNGSSSHTAATLIGSGATLLLVGNIGTLGQLYGGVNDKQRAQTARRTINALQDIEVSRQAYEDSQLIYGFLDSYSNKSRKLLGTMVLLSTDAQDLSRAAPSVAASKRIVELCDKTRETLAEFRVAAGFADEYANQLLRLYKRYHDEVSLPADKATFEGAQQSVKKFIDAYHEHIVPFLEGLPEEIEAMQNIRAAVIANSIAAKQYF